MRFIGIDPGKKGAIVRINSDLSVDQWVIPVDKDNDVDIAELCGLIVYEIDEGDKVGLEEIHSIYGTAKGTMFTMGRVWGNIESALICNNIHFEYVPAKVWQKDIWHPSCIVKKLSKTGSRYVNDTKASSYNTATMIYPMLDFRYGKNENNNNRRTKAHDGIIDALLIAEYIRRKHKYGIK